MLTEQERQQARAFVKRAIEMQEPQGVMASLDLLYRSGKPSDVAFSAASLRQLGDAFRSRRLLWSLRMFIVRSVTVEPILPTLAVEAALAGFLLEPEIGGYGSFFEEMLSPDSALLRSGADVVLVALDLEDICSGLEDLCVRGDTDRVKGELASTTDRVAQMLQTYRSRARARLIFQGFSLPSNSSAGFVAEGQAEWSFTNAVRRLNEMLRATVAAIPDAVFLDMDALAGSFGRDRWTDRRMFLASRLPIAAPAFSAYARGLIKAVVVMFRPAKKVLCTDLDNTLWGGVLGEDGPDGIVTGSSFPGSSFWEYQALLKRLASRGVLLAAVSKNNEADVRAAFLARQADLAISLADFTALKVNWDDKSDSLAVLAQELSLGLDSFVFVDDNPVECAAVRQRLPGVTVIEVAVDRPWELVPALADANLFDNLTVTQDDLARATDYKAQVERKSLEIGAASKEDFLASLEIVCTMVDAREAPLARAVQLMAKTNQFNLTTRRRSATEIEEFANRPAGLAIAVRVRDRFGDAGVTGLVLASRDDGVCVIDSLLLSCRVIGRGIETALLAAVCQRAAAQGCHSVRGEFVPTSKNAPAADFYMRHGFAVEQDHGESGQVYTLDLSHGSVEVPQWIKMEGEQENELVADVV